MNGFDTLKIFINEMERCLVTEEKYAYPSIKNEDIVKIKKAYEVAISSSKVSPEMIYEMVIEK